MAVTREQAHQAIERGWSIIPLNNEKKPLGKWAERQRTAMRLEEIEPQLAPAAALGVVTGQLSGLIILDTDDEQADKFMMSLGLEPHVRTPSGGHHYYFRHPGEGRYKTFNPQNDGQDAQSYRERYGLLDCRADGGYAAFVGTVAKGSYEQLREPTDLYELNCLPAELVATLQYGYRGKSTQRSTSAQTVLKGVGVERLLSEAKKRVDSGNGRDNSCFWLAQQLRDNGHEQQAALTAMEQFWGSLPATNTKGQQEEFPLQTALDKIGAAYEQPAREPWGGPMFAATDIGNGERLAAAAADCLRYNDTMGWLSWDGKRWLGDGERSIEVISKRVAKEMMDEALKVSQRASAIEDEQERNRALAEAKALVAHARNSQSLPRLKAMRELARSEPQIAVRADSFDKSPYLLNVNNGTIDLQTGELLSHRREDMLTRVVPINYVPTAECPNWHKFLRTITGNTDELMRYLKRIAGYVLTGSSQEHAVFILHGEGQNGKSTFVNVLERITGGTEAYAASVDSRSLLNHRSAGNGPNSDIARLHGARLAYASEPDMGKMLDEALLKKLSSGERVTARFLNKENFEFTPGFKLILSANHLPEVRGNDKGIWRRLKLVPFHHTIPDAEKQRDFFEKQLEPELEGILAWAVEGTLEWNQVGLDEPQVVKTATQEYRGEMDLIGHFIESECIVDPAAKEAAGALYSRYKDWAQDNGYFPLSQIKFSRQLDSRGFKSGEKSNGKKPRLGIRLRTQADKEVDVSTSDVTIDDLVD